MGKHYKENMLKIPYRCDFFLNDSHDTYCKSSLVYNKQQTLYHWTFFEVAVKVCFDDLLFLPWYNLGSFFPLSLMPSVIDLQI